MKYIIGIIIVLGLITAFGIGQYKENQQLRAELQSRQEKLEEAKDAAQETKQKLQSTQAEKEKHKEKLQKKRQLEETLRSEVDTLKEKLQAKRRRERRLVLTEPVQAQSQPEPASGSCEDYRSLVDQYDWDTATMMRIMNGESECIPTNHNLTDQHKTCTGSYGLFNIGCNWGYSMSYLENPSNNVKVAYEVWQKQGYSAWTTY